MGEHVCHHGHMGESVCHHGHMAESVCHHGNMGESVCHHGHMAESVCHHGNMGESVCHHGNMGESVCHHGNMGESVCHHGHIKCLLSRSHGRQIDNWLLMPSEPRRSYQGDTSAKVQHVASVVENLRSTRSSHVQLQAGTEMQRITVNV